jgi:hypothetical protein
LPECDTQPTQLIRSALPNERNPAQLLPLTSR